MPSNLEIVSILANEVFTKDNTVLKHGADILAPCSSVWYGQQVEEVRSYLAIAWDSLGDHKSFMADEENVDKVRGSLGPIVVKGATRDLINAHFEVEGAPFSVLSAPVTEFGIVTPKAGHEAEVKNILTKLAAFLNEAESAAVGGVFAPTVEKEGSYLLLVGWDSVEEKSAKGLEIEEELLAHAEVSFSHVKLLQHEGA
ncbi:hypothetical protein EWM64_g4304 [Hericium alpestre]|uniref:ABM domain-containing protein n=1 Tax=Hericium alpestre TaxID=135208 RepID=A0A4Y9ZYX2_9AGAM|nr:hypothetical protein EWM64_g4304 [Hericium alpestre]